MNTLFWGIIVFIVLINVLAIIGLTTLKVWSDKDEVDEDDF